MRFLLLSPLFLVGMGAAAQAAGPDYPGCRIAAQRALALPSGAPAGDRLRAHVSMRADVLQADIGSARRAHRLSRREAGRLGRRVAAVRAGMDGLVRQQGFLSAAERASYDRELDSVALRLCR